MIEWNEYIKYGDFTSKHGVKFKFKWEFDRLNKALNWSDAELIATAVRCLAYPNELVVIDTVNPSILKEYTESIYYPKSKRIHNAPLENYVIYDDVITKGITVQECITVIGREAEAVICIVDREKHDLLLLNIISIIDEIFK